jgi:hypothetical protein
VSKDESDEKVDEVVNLDDKGEKHLIDMDASDEDGEVEQPTVTSWAAEPAMVGKPSASRDIIKLDPADAEKINKQTVESTNINDLLRVLIKRGYDGSNPALAKGGERLLLQLNCIPTSTYRDDLRGGSGGGGGGGRFGNSQGGRGGGGRGQFNGRDRDDRSGGFNRQTGQGGYGRGGPNNGYGRSNDQGSYNSGYGRGRGYGNQRDNYGNQRDNYGNQRDNYGNQRDNYGNQRDNYDNQRNKYDNSGGENTGDQPETTTTGGQNGIMRTFNDRRSGISNKSIGLSSFGQFGGAKPVYNPEDQADDTQ